MFGLIVGIILGACFPEFWAELYQSIKNKLVSWTNSLKSSSTDS